MKDADFYSTIRLQIKYGNSDKWADWKVNSCCNPESLEGKEFIENFKDKIQLLERIGQKNKYRIIIEQYYIPL